MSNSDIGHIVALSRVGSLTLAEHSLAAIIRYFRREGLTWADIEGSPYVQALRDAIEEKRMPDQCDDSVNW